MGNKMIRVGRSRFVLVFMVLAITALGGVLAFTEWQVEAAPVKGTIRFAMWQAEEPGAGDFWREKIAAFKADNPEAQVEITNISPAQYAEKMLVELGAGNHPDLFLIEGFSLPQYIAMGVLRPIDEVYSRSGIKEKMIEPLLRWCQKDGVTYAYPIGARTWQLVYNTEHFARVGIKEPPKTVEDFLAAAKKLTIREGGQIKQFGFAFPNTNDRFLYEHALNWANGYGANFAKDGKPTANDPRVIEGLKQLKRVYDADVGPKGVEVTRYRQYFFEGRVSMMWDLSTMLLYAERTHPGMGKKLAAAHLPFPGGDKATGAVNTNLSIPTKAKNPEAAMRFLETVMTPESSRRWFELTNALPTIQGITTAEFRAANPWYRVYEESLATMIHVPPPGLEEYYGEFSKIVQDHVMEILVKNRAAEDAMNAAQKALEQMVARKRR
jgi:multiple sugar transport system substrate-binding protein